MRSFVYYSCFALVASGILMSATNILFDTDSPFHTGHFKDYTEMLGNPIPVFPLFRLREVGIFSTLLTLASIPLVIRRIYLITYSLIDKIPDSCYGKLGKFLSFIFTLSIICSIAWLFPFTFVLAAPFHILSLFVFYILTPYIVPIVLLIELFSLSNHSLPDEYE